MEEIKFEDFLLGVTQHLENIPQQSFTNNERRNSLDELFDMPSDPSAAVPIGHNDFSSESDVLLSACRSAGIPMVPSFDDCLPQSTIAIPICFDVMPDDVQFRYQKEVAKKNTSPIHGRGGKNVTIKVNGEFMDLNCQYEVEISLVDSQGNRSVHEMYRTKGNTESFQVLNEKVSLDRTTIIIESIGVQRQVKGDGPRRKKEEKDSQDSVWMQAVLYCVNASGKRQINFCYSDEIHDTKKWNLKITHINPTIGMETGKQEMTLLCSKIKPDTKVRFKRDDWVQDAVIIRPHYGVALVLLTPTFPAELMRNVVEEVKVVLYCPITDREGPAVTFSYKADPSTTMAMPFYPMRERSPIRRDGLETDSSVLQEDAITNEMEKLKISAPTSTERVRETARQRDSTVHVSRVTPKHTHMTDLSLVREVACGKKEWCEEVKTVITRSPFILHVQDKNGRTPPMLALTQGREEVFRRFLKATDDENQRQVANSRTPQGLSLLHVMAIPEVASVETLELLLSLDADPRLTDRNGQTMIHWLVQRRRITLLRAAIPVIRRKFRHDNARSVSSEMSNFLNHADNDGRSALHIAVLFDVVAAIKILVDESVDVNNQSRNGMTALHMAVVMNNAGAVDHLVRLGARVNAKTQWGANVRQLAEQNSSLDSKIMDLLESYKRISSRRSSGDSSSSTSGRSD